MSADSDAMKQAVISYPAGLPQMLKLSDSEFARKVRFLAAAKLYELGRLSSGMAARLAGLERVAFFMSSAESAFPPSISARRRPRPKFRRPVAWPDEPVDCFGREPTRTSRTAGTARTIKPAWCVPFR